MNPHRPSLDELAELWLGSLRVRNLSERTLREAAWRLSKFFKYLESRDITDIFAITREVVFSYQTELHRAVNSSGRPNTIGFQNGLLSTVKQFLNWLRMQELIVTDPARDVPYAKVPKRLPQGVLSPSEVRKILRAPDLTSVIGYRDRTILEVLYCTGVRKEELEKLTLADVDYRDGFLRVTGKGGKDRIVPLGRIARRYLENYIRSVRPELVKDPAEQRLFLSARGNPFSKNVVWQITKRYAGQAGIDKNVHPHTFRHTCATAMLRNKANIRVVQELLGHASLSSTQIYTHLTITDLKEVHARCHPREKDKD